MFHHSRSRSNPPPTLPYLLAHLWPLPSTVVWKLPSGAMHGLSARRELTGSKCHLQGAAWAILHHWRALALGHSGSELGREGCGTSHQPLFHRGVYLQRGAHKAAGLRRQGYVSRIRHSCTEMDCGAQDSAAVGTPGWPNMALFDGKEAAPVQTFVMQPSSSSSWEQERPGTGQSSCSPDSSLTGSNLGLQRCHCHKCNFISHQGLTSSGTDPMIAAPW